MDMNTYVFSLSLENAERERRKITAKEEENETEGVELEVLEF